VTQRIGWGNPADSRCLLWHWHDLLCVGVAWAMCLTEPS